MLLTENVLRKIIAEEYKKLKMEAGGDDERGPYFASREDARSAWRRQKQKEEEYDRAESEARRLVGQLPNTVDEVAELFKQKMPEIYALPYFQKNGPTDEWTRVKQIIRIFYEDLKYKRINTLTLSDKLLGRDRSKEAKD